MRPHGVERQVEFICGLLDAATREQGPRHGGLGWRETVHLSQHIDRDAVQAVRRVEQREERHLPLVCVGRHGPHHDPVWVAALAADARREHRTATALYRFLAGDGLLHPVVEFGVGEREPTRTHADAVAVADHLERVRVRVDDAPLRVEQHHATVEPVEDGATERCEYVALWHVDGTARHRPWHHAAPIAVATDTVLASIFRRRECPATWPGGITVLPHAREASFASPLVLLCSN